MFNQKLSKNATVKKVKYNNNTTNNTTSKELSMSTNDYKLFLSTLSWDEFRTYESKVNKDNLTEEQRQILKAESAQRSNNFNNFMSR